MNAQQLTVQKLVEKRKRIAKAKERFLNELPLLRSLESAAKARTVRKLQLELFQITHMKNERDILNLQIVNAEKRHCRTVTESFA